MLCPLCYNRPVTETPTAEIYTAIEARLARLPDHRARVVGVNGVDTAGKTCFARALARHLTARGTPVALVHLDDFHNPRAVRYQEGDTPRSYIRHAFDLPRLARELLAPARRGRVVDATLRLMDLDTDTRTLLRRYVIRRDTVVIVEGVLLYRPPIDAYLDCRVFLHVPFAEVLRRAAQRDIPRYGPAYLARYRAKYIPVQRWYLLKYRPRERSHVVVDNTDYERPRLLTPARP